MRRWLARSTKTLGVLVAAAVLVALAAGWASMGRGAAGARRARVERSPEWRDGHFNNPQPIINDAWGAVRAMFTVDAHVVPDAPLPVVTGGPPRAAPASGLRVTWLGHSTVLIEIDGLRLVTDPVWSERAGPLPWPGPRRWYPPPIPLESLPPLDAVLLSHDHYDHLDRATVIALAARGATFIAPLGVGAHLEYWGVPAARVVELDWWERQRVGALEIVCTPSRHASGRGLLDKDATLWASYALVGPRHRVFYSGDTGLFPGLREIGARLGPFDLTLIEVGQYHAAWPDWHIGPEQAVQAHALVHGRVLLPIHWGLLRLASHGWTEPIERVVAAATRAGATLLTPRPGQSVEPEAPPPPFPSIDRWWPALPFRDGAADPIVSSQMN
jgi:L-ascorbate metabolism protein UlaG (beta-lactamase superfamily)